jgi:peptidyl-Lys metalloendopeptidase
VALTHAELHAGKAGALILGSPDVLVGGASISMEELARADALAMIDKGLASLDRWNEQDRAAFKAWFGTDSEEARQLVRGHLLLMRGKLSKVDFAVGEKNQWAHVFPLGNTVNLDNWFWKSPRFGEDSRSGTVVHETSHFLEAAGTRDVVYGRKACRALAAKDPDKALTNADSHEYWLETLP